MGFHGFIISQNGSGEKCFLHWIALLYKEQKAFVSNQGDHSNWLLLYWGVQQKCPLSPVLLNWCLEVMDINIMGNKHVSGSNLGSVEVGRP